MTAVPANLPELISTINAPRCQCPEEGVRNPVVRHLCSDEEWAVAAHAPGECRGTLRLAKYQRGDKILWLCSCCNLSWDVRLDQ